MESVTPAKINWSAVMSTFNNRRKGTVLGGGKINFNLPTHPVTSLAKTSLNAYKN